MFGPPACAYSTAPMASTGASISCASGRQASAVLIRALEPIEGPGDHAQAARRLAGAPALLRPRPPVPGARRHAQAQRAGARPGGRSRELRARSHLPEIAVGTRVGIAEAIGVPWRFGLQGLAVPEQAVLNRAPSPLHSTPGAKTSRRGKRCAAKGPAHGRTGRWRPGSAGWAPPHRPRNRCRTRAMLPPRDRSAREGQLQRVGIVEPIDRQILGLAERLIDLWRPRDVRVDVLAHHNGVHDRKDAGAPVVVVLHVLEVRE